MLEDEEVLRWLEVTFTAVGRVQTFVRACVLRFQNPVHAIFEYTLVCKIARAIQWLWWHAAVILEE